MGPGLESSPKDQAVSLYPETAWGKVAGNSQKGDGGGCIRWRQKASWGLETYHLVDVGAEDIGYTASHGGVYSREIIFWFSTNPRISHLFFKVPLFVYLNYILPKLKEK